MLLDLTNSKMELTRENINLFMNIILTPTRIKGFNWLNEVVPKHEHVVWKICTQENQIRGIKSNVWDCLIILKDTRPELISIARECWAYVPNSNIITLDY